MTKYDEYCYNLMEDAIKQGAGRHGIPQEECVALMNIMLGTRGVEKYINDKKEIDAILERYMGNREPAEAETDTKEREDDINGETMGD